MDRLLLQARSEQNAQARQKLYADAEQLIVDDAVIIPDFWPVVHLLVKPCVKNWPDLSMSVEKYRYIEIDSSKGK